MDSGFPRSIFALFALLIWPTNIAAHCDLSRFDRTPPSVVKGTVNDHSAHFEWASDVDVFSGRSWQQNYILNKHTSKGWTGYWEKSDIVVPVTRPLPAGKFLCREVLLGRHHDILDTDAPIIYGTNRQRQRAAVFTAKEDEFISKKEVENWKEELKNWVSLRIQTSFLDLKDQIQEFHLEVSIIPKDKDLFQFNVRYDPPHFIVGLSGIREALPRDQLNIMMADAESAGRRIEYNSLVKFAGILMARELFPTDPDKIHQDFMFFTDSMSQLIKTNSLTNVVRRVIVDLVVLDKELRPVLASKLTIPLLH